MEPSKVNVPFSRHGESVDKRLFANVLEDTEILTGFLGENTPSNTFPSFNRIGKKRTRSTHREDEIQQIPSSPIQQTARTPSPIVIDLTEDNDTITRNSPISLSVGQDHSSFEKDHKLAMELQLNEYSVANARASHSQIQPFTRRPSTYHTSFGEDLMRPSWSSFQTDNRSFQPPWSRSNYAPYLSFFQR